VIQYILVVLCFFFCPSDISCPPHWHAEGVRLDGLGSCAPNPVGDPDWDGTWLRPDRSTQPPGRIWYRIYCTGGESPVVRDDGMTVGCQHVSYDTRMR